MDCRQSGNSGDNLNILQMDSSYGTSSHHISRSGADKSDPLQKTPPGSNSAPGSSSRADFDSRNRNRQRLRPKTANTPEELVAKAERNRAAQRAFRQRRDQYVKDLEWRATQLEEMQHVVHQLADENQMLRMRVESLTHHINQFGLSVPPLPPLPPLNRQPVDWVPVIHHPQHQQSASQQQGSNLGRRPDLDNIQRIASQPSITGGGGGGPLSSKGTQSPTIASSSILNPHNQQQHHQQMQLADSNEDKFNTGKGGQPSTFGFSNILQSHSHQQNPTNNPQAQAVQAQAQAQAQAQNNMSRFMNSNLDPSNQIPILQSQGSNLDFQSRNLNNPTRGSYLYQSPTSTNNPSNPSINVNPNSSQQNPNPGALQSQDYNPFNDRVAYQQLGGNSYVVPTTARYSNEMRVDMRYADNYILDSTDSPYQPQNLNHIQ